jgi:hypothetical protein
MIEYWTINLIIITKLPSIKIFKINTLVLLY